MHIWGSRRRIFYDYCAYAIVAADCTAESMAPAAVAAVLAQMDQQEAVQYRLYHAGN